MNDETSSKIQTIQAELSQLGPDFKIEQREGYDYPNFNIAHIPTGTQVIYRVFYNSAKLIPVFKKDSRGDDHRRDSDPDLITSMSTKATGKALARKIKALIEPMAQYQAQTLDPRIFAAEAAYEKERDADSFVNKTLGTRFPVTSAENLYLGKNQIKIFTKVERRGNGKFSLLLRDVTPEAIAVIAEFLNK